MASFTLNFLVPHIKNDNVSPISVIDVVARLLVKDAMPPTTVSVHHTTYLLSPNQWLSKSMALQVREQLLSKDLILTPTAATVVVVVVVVVAIIPLRPFILVMPDL